MTFRKKLGVKLKKIEFIFDIDDKVRTCFDTDGIIAGLFYDASGNQYSVRTKDGDKWFKEKEIKKRGC